MSNISDNTRNKSLTTRVTYYNMDDTVSNDESYSPFVNVDKTHNYPKTRYFPVANRTRSRLAKLRGPRILKRIQ